MAKSRAQRKAEQRRRRAQGGEGVQSDSEAQERTQVPHSANVDEAELAEKGADLDQLKGDPEEQPEEQPEAPAPSRAETAPAKAEGTTRRERKRAERERREAAKAQLERRKPREAPVERDRGRVMGFLASCVAELRRVQWPNRETLIQASAVTLVFIAVAAVYLGALDAAFNWLVQLIL